MSEEEEEAPMEETFEDAGGEEEVAEDVAPEYQSWKDRLTDSVSKVGLGFFVFIACIYVLWHNESNLVDQRTALLEAEELVVELPHIDKVDPWYNGKLVHVVGHTEAGSAVTDPIFGVSMEDTLKLKRTVKMYQWKESEDKRKAPDGKGTYVDYHHHKDWFTHVIPTSEMKEPQGHRNPTKLCYPKEVFDADPIMLGAYELADIVTDKIHGYTAIPPTEIVLDDIPEATLNASSVPITLYSTKGFYVGAGTNAIPKVGDCRITFEAIPEKNISVVGLLTKNTFGEYTTSNDVDVILVQDGILAKDAMFDSANDDETFKAIAIRILGFLGIWIGLVMMTEPFAVFMDIIPIIGGVVEFGLAIFDFLVALIVSLVVIAVAWLWFRPVFSLILFGSIGVIVAGIFYLKSVFNKPKGTEEESKPLNPDGDNYTDEPEA